MVSYLSDFSSFIRDPPKMAFFFSTRFCYIFLAKWVVGYISQVIPHIMEYLHSN